MTFNQSFQLINLKDFNSHAHVERDDITLALMLAFSNFNSHAHVERDGIIINTDTNSTDFNSHAHVERDVYCKHYGGTIEISTHTLTWSVTVVKP